jgi:copper(I)-binding protein
MNIKKAVVLFAAVLALGGLVAACSSDNSTSGTDQISVSDVWTRITTPTATTGAVYMNLESPDGDKLIKASVPTDVAAVTEIHETVSGEGMEGDSMDSGSGEGTTMEGGMAVEPADDAEGSMEGMDDEGATGEDSAMSGGMMGMRPIDSLTLPAGEEVALEPGGYHIMLIDLAEPIEEGDTVPVTLTFENAGEIEVEAEARES